MTAAVPKLPAGAGAGPGPGPDRALGMLDLCLVAAGAAAFVPVLVRLFADEWAQPESGHGPIILALSLWLFGRAWARSREDAHAPAPAAPAAGWLPVLLAAGALYFIGFVGEIAQLAYGALMPWLAAVVLAFRPARRWRDFAFPIAFLLFSVPLPGFIVDPVTLPMKTGVSMITEAVLHAAGYPVSRAGVVLYVGPYQLLVADACAGLRTLFTLEALGLFYLNVVEHASPIRNVGLALLIIPISLVANALRVLILCLITYHLGDEAGQGFLHEFAGLALFLFGLTLLVGVDGALRSLAARLASRRPVRQGDAG